MRVAVLTISDSVAKGEREDRSGPATVEVLRQHGFTIAGLEVVPDDQPAIEAQLIQLSDQVNLIVTTGGTGVAERDVTPEEMQAAMKEMAARPPQQG